MKEAATPGKIRERIVRSLQEKIDHMHVTPWQRPLEIRPLQKDILTEMRPGG